MDPVAAFAGVLVGHTRCYVAYGLYCCHGLCNYKAYGKRQKRYEKYACERLRFYALVVQHAEKNIVHKIYGHGKRHYGS